MEPRKPICKWCDSPDVVNEHCTKCNNAYCALCSSKINPALYCDECQRDVVIEETTRVRTDTDWDIKNDRMVRNTNKTKVIMYKGIDWMFAAKKICELPDEELKSVLYYHRGMVMQMEQELLTRSINKAHAAVQVTRDANSIVSISKQTKIKTTKTAKLAPSIAVTPELLLQLAIKHGITSKEELLDFLAKAKATTQ